MANGSLAPTLSLEDRVRRLEDVEAIQRVMTRYGSLVDNDYDLVGMEGILTEDLVWSSNAFGSYGNRREYLEGQAKISTGVAWAFHVMTPIEVEIESDDTGSGVFYLLMLGTFIDGAGGGSEPVVVSARYNNGFRREDHAWRCSRMNVHFHQVSRLSEGWVRDPFWSS